jgi:hypothetical protein
MTGGSSSQAHQLPPNGRIHEPVSCDRCTNTFKTRQEYNSHRSYMNNGPCADHNHRTPPQNRVGYRDPDMPRELESAPPHYPAPGELNEAAEHSDSPPSDLSESELWCSDCKNRFQSKAGYYGHFLRCVADRGMSDSKSPAVEANTVEVSQATRSNGHPGSASSRRSRSRKAPSQVPIPQLAAPTAPRAQAPVLSLSSSAVVASSTFACNTSGCQKTFKSQPGLTQHKKDAHGIGGPMVDLMGRDAWRLGQRAREQARAEGLLRPPTDLSRGRGGIPNGRTAPQAVGPPFPQSPRMMFRPQHHPTPAPIPAFGTSPRASMPVHHSPHYLPVQQAQVHATMPLPLPTGRNVGGPIDMEQAKYIYGKILSLMIQSDIFIHHDGKMTVCDIGWTRIGVERQHDVVGMFDNMCHLPRNIQGEQHVPSPKAFLGDYTLHYPLSEFQPSPPRNRANPGLGVVAMACSKVVLANGLEEIVKISAVDVITCRILMNHLVCTDSSVKVKDWRSNETGLYSWDDMEHARKLNYKVFKGWSAVRSALWKFVDKETIILGHNLRSDLDALRMVHGRAVDITKVAEKAAKGPLSKVQLSLDSMCRDFPAVMLKSDPKYGRDVLMNAFAVREFGLWTIKNTEPFEKKIRQKSLDYQKVMPGTAAPAV